MSKIKSVIALSDLHLGRDFSYLYSKDPKFQKNREALLAILKGLGRQDEIILNGDFLELSIGGFDEIYNDVKEFFKILAEAGSYKRIVFVPGNHDHHFWRTLGEQVYINGKISKGEDPPGHDEYPYCFIDERFSSKDPKLPCKILLSDLWPKKEPVPEIVVKYPHHLIKVASDDENEHYYLITHGHFLEDLFKPVNYLIEPAHLEELEAFNNVWVEAFDYHLGHSGRLSEKIRILVNSYEKGGRDARRKINEVLNEVYHNLKNKLKLCWFKALLLKIGLKIIVRNIPLEKKSGLFKVPAIDDKLKQNIVEYVSKYIIHRYRKGKAAEYHFPSDSDIPHPFTFVFGHTHKPVREKDLENAVVYILGKKYPLANTGGWLRTDGTGSANGENAGVLVIDQTGVRWETLEGKLE